MKKDYMIPTIEVLEMKAQPLLTSSLVIEGTTDTVDSRDDILDLFEIGDKYEGGF